jgi:hypothetical protein
MRSVREVDKNGIEVRTLPKEARERALSEGGKTIHRTSRAGSDQSGSAERESLEEWSFDHSSDISNLHQFIQTMKSFISGELIVLRR